MSLFRMTAGTRVRYWYGGEPIFGTVEGVAVLGPWVKVKWDDPNVPQMYNNMMAGELQNPDDPLPLPLAPDTSEIPF